MSDTILDDVNTLILKGLGDKRILEQIKRAAEHNEVISVYERNYVAKLRDELRPERKKRTPSLPYYAQTPVRPMQQISAAPQEPQVHKRNRRTRNVVLVGVALAAVIAIGISASGIIGGGLGPVIADLSVDEQSYSIGDIISISGKSDILMGGQVVLSIESPNDDLVWTENLNLKSDGAFSTLAIAGGTGWGSDGTYTLIMKHGNETASLDFDFQG